MAIRIYAIIPDMNLAVSKLTTDVTDFSAATQATKEAADTVAAGWEGDAREAFVTEQREAIPYYNEMAQLVNDYIGKVRSASKAYTTTDAEGARILRAV